jgi:hypothetical protein
MQEAKKEHYSIHHHKPSPGNHLKTQMFASRLPKSTCGSPANVQSPRAFLMARRRLMEIQARRP